MVERLLLEKSQVSPSGGPALRLERTGETIGLERVAPSPCTAACPAGVNVKAYVSLVAEGRFADAWEVASERCPLPGVCGRVCTHPCEAACRRGKAGGPLAIRALKRFVADYALERGLRPPPLPEPTRPERVAVVGSGPAGLTAAHDLARAGFPVSLFEAEEELGGTLRLGIPPFRLPRDIIEAEVRALLEPVVEIRTGAALGREFTLDELFDRHQAVFLGIGAMRGRALGLPGEKEAAGITDALAFLRGPNRGEAVDLRGKRVAVVGGGSSAVDAARTSLRLGAQAVEIVYRRGREEMPAAAEEVDAAEAEGVKIRFLAIPDKLRVEGGRVTGLYCVQARLGEPDSSGRRRPIPIPDSQFLVEADLVIPAVSQDPDLEFLKAARHSTREAMGGEKARWIHADPETLATGKAGVFGGGDAVTGPATVIEAIAAGHKAALSIRRYLDSGSWDGGDYAPGPWPPAKAVAAAPAGAEFAFPEPLAEPLERLHLPELPIAERGSLTAEVELPLDAEAAIAEARRCLRCGPCAECEACVSTCARRHVLVTGAPGEAGLEPLSFLVRAPRRGFGTGLEAGPLAARFLERAGAVPGDGGAHYLIARLEADLDPILCRGCGRCVEVCSFKALRLEGAPAPEGDGLGAVASLEAGLCRGCGLCAGVCPTGAVRVRPFDARPRAPVAAPGKAAGTAVLTCLRRGLPPEPLLAAPRGAGETVTVPVPCAGAIEVGAILDLLGRGFGRVAVVSCGTGACRFEKRGPELAAERCAEAQAYLRLIGDNPGRVEFRIGEPGQSGGPTS